MRDDYYEILGVKPEADRRDIRAAYHRLAMQLHPDHNENDAASVEKFKLLAEAWHELGDAARRAEYDSWLERHRRYDRLPELAQMPRHHARMSSRNAERRSERRNSRYATGSRGRVRPFLLRRSMRVPVWQYVLMCVMCLCCIVPGVMRAVRGIERGAAVQANAERRGEPGESPLPPEEQKKGLQRYLDRISIAAQKGEPAAQFAYGNLLYNGVAGLDMAPDAAAAREWWRKAAAQGYRPAQRALDSTPYPDPAVEESRDAKKSRETQT